MAVLLVFSLVLAVCPVTRAAEGEDFVAASRKIHILDEKMRSIDFNEGWKFYLATRSPQVNGTFATGGVRDAGDYTTEQIVDPSFDDAQWRSLCVPHDFSIEGERTTAAGMGIFTGFYQGGLGWYRKTFSVPAGWEGETKISIDFEGVYHHSVVYVNGQLVGNYPNGYTGFAYDITEFLRYGGEPNVIVVKVQAMGPSGRWYTGAGINRPVRLVVTGRTRFLRDGIVLTAPGLKEKYEDGGTADLAVRAVACHDNAAGLVAVRTQVFDAVGVKVAESTSEYTPAAQGAEVVLSGTVSVPDVRLWSTDDPYRYHVTNQLLYKASEGEKAVAVDECTEKYGFRYVEVDPSAGLFVNGEYTKLRGVNLHSDNGALGIAGTYDAFERELAIMKSMGVNAFRTAHNPPSKAIIDLCSEMGILVCEEAFDGWGAAKYVQYDFSVFFLREVPADFTGLSALRHTLPEAHPTWSDWVLQQMVYRDINEASVIMWSIGNEVALNGAGARPEWYDYRRYLQERDDYEISGYTETSFDLFTETLRLRNDVLAADSTRYVVAATDKARDIDNEGNKVWIPITRALDGVGFNYYTAASVDAHMARFPDKFFFDSESSSYVSSRGVYMTPSLPNTPVDDTPGHRGVSSYDNKFSSATQSNEYCLKKDRDRANFLGQFIWTGHDYLGEPTPYTSTFPVGTSFFGAVDLAGFPKDPYYLFQSRWSSEPMAHIVPMNWNDYYPDEVVEVWVNTNAPKAELFLNGTSLGVKEFDLKYTADGRPYYETTEPTRDGGGTGYKVGADVNEGNPGGYVSPNGSYGKLHLTWYVPFCPGTLEVRAMDGDNRVVATDSVTTAGAAHTIALTPHVSVAEPGRRLVYVACDIVDKNGVTLPSADNRIRFDVEGNGTIVGVDNGKQDSAELYKWGGVDRNTHAERTAWQGKALVIVETGLETGDIVLTVSSEGLLPTVLTIPTDGGAASSAHPALGPVKAVSAQTVRASLNRPVTLPRYVSVTYASGTAVDEPVTWQADASTFATAGGKVVSGRFDNPALSGVTPTIFVAVAAASDRVNLGLHMALGNNSQAVASDTGPVATASFTSSGRYPNNMLNGNPANSWTNYNASIAATSLVDTLTDISRPYEWIETRWPSAQTFDEVRLDFVLNANNSLPSRVLAWYWDGREYQSVTNPASALVDGTDNVMSITFDPVVSSKIRVGLINGTPFTTTGSFTVSSFATMGDDHAGAVQGTEIVNPTVNFKTQPMGIETDNLRFGWKMESDVVGMGQKTYQIVVTEGTPGGRIVWDSKVVSSGISVAVPYGGEPSDFLPETRYYWTVTVTDVFDTVHAATDWFETGADWGAAKWITIEDFAAGTKSLLFRSEQPLADREIVSARLYVTALGVYDAYINGRLVQGEVGSIMAPGWTDYSSYIHYQTYDVTDYLSEDDRAVTLSAVVGSGWYDSAIVDPAANGYRDVIGKTGADAPLERCLYAKMTIVYADGETQTIVTDTDNWRVSAQSPYEQNGLWEGEVYNAGTAKALGPWNEAGYDISGWSAPEALTYKGNIYAGSDSLIYDYRELPLKSAYTYNPSTDIINEGNPYPEGEIDATKAISYGVGEAIRLKAGDTLVADFGQNAAARVAFEVEAPAGTTILMNPAEILSDGLDAGFAKGAPVIPGAAQNSGSPDGIRFRYTAAGDGVESYEARFHFVGYQYLSIQADRDVTFHSLSSIAISSVGEEIGFVETSSDYLNQFIKNSKWSQASNYASVPTDCPTREYQGWSGDAQIFVESGMYHFDSALLIGNYISIMDDYYQTYNSYGNIMPMHTASFFSRMENAGWCDAGIIVPYWYWQYTGDSSLIERYWDTMCKYVDKQGDTGVMMTLGDWNGVSGEGANGAFVRRIFNIYDNYLMAKMARYLGKEEDTARYEANLARKIPLAAAQTGSNGMGTAQTAYAWALKLGIYDSEAQRQAIAAALADSVWNRNQSVSEKRGENTVGVGFLGVNVVMPALSDSGYGAAAYDLMLSSNMYSPAYSVSRGANTMWERWDMWTPERGYLIDNTSYNHYSYGAASEWIYEYLLGIQKDEENPGFKHFVLQPTVDAGGRVTWAKGSYDSVYGAIYSAWTADDAGRMTSYVCAVPANTAATLYLPVPASAAAGLTGVPGLTYLGQETHNGADSAKFSLLSGHYALDLIDGVLTTREPAAQVVLDKKNRTVTVTGTGFRPGRAVPLLAGYNAAPTAEANDCAAEVVADAAGNVSFTLPAEVTESLPWLGGHSYHIELDGITASAPIPALDVRAHSSARISLRIKGKAPLNLRVDAIPEVYTVASSNPAIASVDQTSGGWVVTGKKAGTALVVVRVAEAFGGATHLVTVSVA
ncbi:MAG: family 78 glycoside hydrolase catalytic domain [Oscillospiraceae bacterium]|nr:family 78 glycoside hydrolase catalytic domain [Oscillospiraceae bacterium]